MGPSYKNGAKVELTAVTIDKTNAFLGATVKNVDARVVISRIVAGGAVERDGRLQEGRFTGVLFGTFLTKISFFPKFRRLSKTLVFGNNFYFCLRSKNFCSKSDCCSKISIYAQTFDFWPKFRSVSKVLIFVQNFGFCQNLDFYQQFRLLYKISFLSKTTIFVKNTSFCSKFRLLSLIQVFVQNFDFCSKSRFLSKITSFYDFI